MFENDASAPPSQQDLIDWADDYGIEHPVVGDPDGANMPFVVEGYPTYPVIDVDMTIANPDLFPFDCAAVGAMI